MCIISIKNKIMLLDRKLLKLNIRIFILLNVMDVVKGALTTSFVQR